jgi:hypothetical protein
MMPVVLDCAAIHWWMCAPYYVIDDRALTEPS